MADKVWTIANMLLDCLQEQFLTDVDGLPTPAEFCLLAGEQMVEDIDPITGRDRCCEGMGWVRIGDAFPSSNFPEPDPVTAKCLPTSWAQNYEIGLLGCYTRGGDPSMQTCPQLTANAAADSARLMVIKKAICCFGTALNKDTRGRLWTTLGVDVSGPRGTCISRVGSLLVSTPTCC